MKKYLLPWEINNSLKQFFIQFERHQLVRNRLNPHNIYMVRQPWHTDGKWVIVQAGFSHLVYDTVIEAMRVCDEYLVKCDWMLISEERAEKLKVLL